MTKAETLKMLKDLGHNVLDIEFFSVREWLANKEKILSSLSHVKNPYMIRSSAIEEDKEGHSCAGKYKSIGPTLS